MNCRYCLDSTNEPLIQPCKCKEKVHYSCLHRWRTKRVDNRNQCSECLAQYSFVRDYTYPMLLAWFVLFFSGLYWIVFAESDQDTCQYSNGRELQLSWHLATRRIFLFEFFGIFMVEGWSVFEHKLNGMPLLF